MAEPQIIFAEDVNPALEKMALTVGGLVDAVRYADAERALCTAHDPRGFDLITMNARLARALRDQFVGEEWELDETDNQPGIRNPRLKLRVIPCNFDQNAGNRLTDPTNLREKGAASSSKAQCNKTAWLPGLEPVAQDEPEEYDTFVLGTYVDDDGVVRAELSRPLNFSSGKYTQFQPRIILLTGDEDHVGGGRQPREEPTEIIDIAVTRK